MQRTSLTALAAILAWSVGWPVSAQSEPRGLVYSVEIVGLEDSALQKQLKKLSETIENRKDRPATVVHLRRRMERDVEVFLNALHAEGYYSATIETDVVEQTPEIVARFEIELGPQYTLDALSIEPAGDAPDGVLPGLAEIGLEHGAPARAQLVLDAQRRLTAHVRTRGYPFGAVTDRETIVDRTLHTMDVRFTVDLGDKAIFGELQVTGLNKVDASVVEIEVPWGDGDLYDARVFEKYRKRLYDTQLFSVVRLEPGEAVTPEGEIPIELEVVERKHRTISLGLEYNTDEGFGSVIEWELRNLWGLGHRFNWETRLGETRQESTLTLTLERFLQRQGQRLNLALEGGRYTPDAFTTQRVSLSAIFERDFTERLTGAGGVALRYSEVEQLDVTDTFQFVSFPLRLTWDRSNSKLDPTRGFRLAAETEPFIDVIGEPSRFLKTQLTGSYYQPFDDKQRWVLAGRATIGSIVGDSMDRVPADERFYAGGGGSIRGYPFQSVGPLEDGEPTGGLSLFEASVEMRARFTESFGIVGFLDAGSAFESSLPDFSEEIVLGTGAGIRYFSPIGPFRFDVGFPLIERDNVDDSFQIYVSIGQSF